MTTATGTMNSHVDRKEKSMATSDICHRISDKAGDLKKDIKELGQIAKEATQEQLESLQEGGMKQARRVAEEIKGHPLSSLLIAAGAGVLFGYLMRGGSSD